MQPIGCVLNLNQSSQYSVHLLNKESSGQRAWNLTSFLAGLQGFGEFRSIFLPCKGRQRHQLPSTAQISHAFSASIKGGIRKLQARISTHLGKTPPRNLWGNNLQFDFFVLQAEVLLNITTSTLFPSAVHWAACSLGKKKRAVFFSDYFLALVKYV